MDEEIIVGKRQKIFPQEFFDALFKEAVMDLRKGGFKEDEIFAIIEEQFGAHYANQFCEGVS